MWLKFVSLLIDYYITIASNIEKIIFFSSFWNTKLNFYYLKKDFFFGSIWIFFFQLVLLRSRCRLNKRTNFIDVCNKDSIIFFLSASIAHNRRENENYFVSLIPRTPFLYINVMLKAHGLYMYIKLKGKEEKKKNYFISFNPPFCRFACSASYIFHTVFLWVMYVLSYAF